PAASSRPALMRTAAISTIRALAGSSPVVSVSGTTATSAISGVALSTAAIGYPERSKKLAIPVPDYASAPLTIPISGNGQTSSICGDLAQVNRRPRAQGDPGAAMLQGWVVIVVALGYIGLLFVIASYGDRARAHGSGSRARMM